MSDQLPKEYPRSKRLPDVMGDFGAQLSFGSPSERTWQRACDVSLERSHARRRHPGPAGWLVVAHRVVMALVVLAAIAALAVAVLYAVKGGSW
jgi:hypothetical protein